MEEEISSGGRSPAQGPPSGVKAPQRAKKNVHRPNESLLKPLFSISSNSEDKLESDFPCGRCSKIFFNKIALDFHELEHTKREILERMRARRHGEKCEFCDKYFLNSDEYKWHRAECIGKQRAAASDASNDVERSRRKR